MIPKILGYQGDKVIVNADEWDAFKDEVIQAAKQRIELLEGHLDELVTYLMVLEVLEPYLSEEIRDVLAEHVDYSEEKPKLRLVKSDRGVSELP